MSKLTLAILRQPSGLVAIQSVAQHSYKIPKYGDRLVQDRYILRSVRVTEGDGGLSKLRLGELQAAWLRLGSVARYDAAVANDIAEILTSTLPDESDPMAQPWRPPQSPHVPRATAAHPRAFQGTKFQPPSAARESVIDLRDHLCNARDTRRIVDHVELSKRKGIRSAIDAFCVAPKIRNTFWQYWRSNGTFDRVQGLYWDLSLNRDEPLRQVVARIMCESCGGAMPWVEAAALLPPLRRTTLLETVHQLGLHRQESKIEDSELIHSSVARLDQLCDDPSFAMRCYALLQSIHYGHPPAAMLAGFELANEYNPTIDFRDRYANADIDTALIQQWIEYVMPASEELGWDPSPAALHLWTDLSAVEGAFEEFQQIFRLSTETVQVQPIVALNILHPLRNCCYHDTAEACVADLAALRPYLEGYTNTILEVPQTHQLRGIDIFASVADLFPHESYRDVMPMSLQVIRRFARDPFSTHRIVTVFSALMNLHQDDLTRLLDADLKTLLVIDRAAANENRATLIAKGITRLGWHHSTWLVDSLLQCPSITLRAAQTVGCHAKTTWQAAYDLAMRHPLMTLDVAEDASDESRDRSDQANELKKLVDAIVDHLPEGVHNPLPRKVKGWRDGTVTLSAGQISRAVAKITDQLLTTRVDLGRHIVLQSLAESMGVGVEAVEDASIRHAVAMQNQADENRRSIRKFLRAYFGGDHDYLMRHPANRRWIDSHPYADSPSWRGDFQVLHPCDGQQLTLAIESNPLEAYRLGTYVGSCLGSGGMLAASSAAVVLDVNKAVVYARNDRGKVVGRQLLAISDCGKLVPYCVYPTSVSPDLQAAFVQFDQALAERLALPIYQDDDHDDSDMLKISSLISSYWWDDTPWSANENRCAQ